jgi:RNA polymerase sigma-70 factor (ECF subfamily)
VTEDDFRDAFDTHFETVRRYLARRCPVAEADDLAAETFLVLWRRRAEAPAGDRVVPWLVVTARNLLANHHRRQQRRRLHDTIVGDVSAVAGGDVPVATTGDRALDIALAGLDPLDREILLMDVWDGLSGRQIADVVGLSVNAVHLRLSRTRRRLRDLLAP